MEAVWVKNCTMADVVSQLKLCRFCIWIGAFTYKMARILQILSPHPPQPVDTAEMTDRILQHWQSQYLRGLFGGGVGIGCWGFLRQMQRFKVPLASFEILVLLGFSQCPCFGESFKRALKWMP